MDIWSLKRQGFSDRAIARKLGIDRRTVKKYIEAREFPKYKAVNRKSGLEAYHELIKGWLAEDDYQATNLYEKVILQGYRGSYTTVKRYVRGIKEERDRVAYVRFETAPGFQAQMDIGEFKVRCEDAEEITVYAMIMVLGFSRHMYVEFVERCTMSVFLDFHMNAFGYFKGVPGEILYDNMKNVVIKHNVGVVKFNDTILDFGLHYRFKPTATPPYSPWCKGKVERPIDYVRERFWRGYKYIDLETLNRDSMRWLKDVAYNRLHGTTRQKVSDRFAVEQPMLGDIPNRPYDTSEKVNRKVYKDCQIAFDGNRYVVPHKYVGKDVHLKVKNGTVRIFHKTIDEYDFNFHEHLDKRMVMDLFDLEFVGRHENVIFLGPPGVGKTHLATSLLIKACYSGLSIYFTTMPELIKKLRKDADVNGRGRAYNKSALVVVDEIGYEPIDRKEAHMFFKFISNRYEQASTIITSNKSFVEWEEMFGDQVIATAILDRLLHHCRVVNIKGNSYRMKDYQEKHRVA